MPERQREGDHVGDPDRDPGGEQLNGSELSSAEEHLLNQYSQIRQCEGADDPNEEPGGDTLDAQPPPTAGRQPDGQHRDQNQPEEDEVKTVGDEPEPVGQPHLQRPENDHGEGGGPAQFDPQGFDGLALGHADYCRARIIRIFSSCDSTDVPVTSTIARLTVPVKAKGGL